MTTQHNTFNRTRAYLDRLLKSNKENVTDPKSGDGLWMPNTKTD